MRASVASLSKKFISTLFAATLAFGLVPAAAFAVEDDGAEAPKSAESAEADSFNTGDLDQSVISSEVEQSADTSSVIPSDSEESSKALTTSWEDDQATVIPAVSERINQDVALQTRTVAQAESTRSYFLAQTLESTRTVPIVSANLPLDTGSVEVVAEDNEASQDEEGDGSEDDPDADDPVDASFTLASSESDSAVSAESTVIGSFTYLGMTFAVEPGGESVALVAVDYAQLPEAFIEKQIIVIPDAVTADGMNNYSVTRIADDAFASLTKENANEDYKGCEALFTDEELIAEADIDAAEVEAFLNSESDTIDIDGDGEADGPANPLKDCTGILALGVPASITNIGDEAFAGFDTLQYLVVSEDNPNYATFDGVLYDADLTDIRLIPEGRVGAVRVASSATDVDPEVFSHCPSVTTLVADPESELMCELGQGERPACITSFSASTAWAELLSLPLNVCQAMSSFGLDAASPSVFSSFGSNRLILNARTTGWRLIVVAPNDASVYRCTRKLREDGTWTDNSSISPMTSSFSDAYAPRGEVASSKRTHINSTYNCVRIELEDLDETSATFGNWLYYFGVNNGTMSSTGQCPGGVTSAALYTINIADGQVRDSIELTSTTINPADLDFSSTTNFVLFLNGAEYRTLTFNGNGGTVLTSTKSGKCGDEITPPTASRAGYTFSGWYTAASGGYALNDIYGKTYVPSPYILGGDDRMKALAGTKTFYAHWTAYAYKITLNTGGANVSNWAEDTAKQKYHKYYTVEDSITLPTLSKTGYTFNGWTGSNGSTASTSVTVAKGSTGDKTYTASWTATGYTITLNTDGGSVSGWTQATANQKYTKSYNITSEATTLPTPTRAGYTFNGWTGSNGSTASTSVTVAKGSTGDKSYTANWSANTITLTWARNDGSNTNHTTTSETYSSSTKVPMPTSDPTRAGYTFANWYTDPTNGTQVTSSTTLPTSNTTYYAHWTATGYTITLNTDGGSVSGWTQATANQKYTKSYNVTSADISLPTPTRSGYTFNGWTGSNGTTAQTSVTVAKGSTGDKSYTASWTANTITLTWARNDGSNTDHTTTSATYSSSTKVPMPTSDPTRTGYTFADWWTGVTGGTQVTSSTALPTSNTTYYAHWTLNKHDVKWDYKIDGKAVKTVSTEFGKTFSMENPGTKTGYTFAGWLASEPDSGLYGYDGKPDGAPTTYTMKDKAVTFTAQWTANGYTVSFEGRGGTGGQAGKSVDVTFDRTVTAIDTTPPHRDGYEFEGWWDSDTDEDTGDMYYDKYGTPKRVWKKASDATLYAHWSRDPFDAVNLLDTYLDSGDKIVWYWPERGYVADDSEDAAEVKAEEHLTDAPEIGDLKYDYKFLGWFDTEDQDVTSDAHKMIDADGALLTDRVPEDGEAWYAHWERIACPVELVAAYGEFDVDDEGSPSTIEHVAFGQPFNSKLASIEKPFRTGYTFMGYFTEPNAERETSVDVSDYEGERWIDEKGNLLSKEWRCPEGLEKRAAVTLYAAWRLDDCRVVFDVERIDADTLLPADTEAVAGKPDDQTWHYGKPLPAKLPTPEDGIFSRNGYDFLGWHYVKDGKVVPVSDEEGNPLVLPVWDDTAHEVTLYADWKARTYRLAFDENLPKLVETVDEGTSAEPAIVEVAYDGKLSLPAPSFKEYEFSGWYVTATGEPLKTAHMTGDRFTPRGDLALQTTDPIPVHALWNAPGQKHYALYVGIPGGTEVLSVTGPYEYGYTAQIVFNDSVKPVSPVKGYTFAGWVKVADEQAAYDLIAEGGPDKDAETTPKFGPYSNENLCFVAKWSTMPLKLTLRSTPFEDDDGAGWLMGTDLLIDRESDDAALAWSDACAAAHVGSPQSARELVYDVEAFSFALPDVKRQGAVFKGWKQVSPAGEESPEVVVRPSAQAEHADTMALVYAPVFEEATYTIVLDGNGYGIEETHPDVAFSDTFPMPYPSALQTGACFASWASEPNTLSSLTEIFFPEDEVPVAPTYDEKGEVAEFGLAQLADEENVIRLYAVWNKTYNIDVPLFATMAIDTQTGDMLAGSHTLTPWEDAQYSIESLRYEPMTDASGNYAFAGAEGAYLSVYAGLSLASDYDERELLRATNVSENGAITYADASKATRTASPLLIKLGSTTPIVIGRPALKAVTNGTCGFKEFGLTSPLEPLTVRYGLYFEDADTAKRFDFREGGSGWMLPRNDAGGANGLSSTVAPVARLRYAVSMTPIVPTTD